MAVSTCKAVMKSSFPASNTTSNIVPWQMLCLEKGAHLRVVRIDDDGVIPLDQFGKALNERTRLVALSHVSNSLGTVNPLRQMIEMAHRWNCPVVVDGAQAVPHMPVDVRSLDADFYAFSGHKLFGPTGIGVLYGKEALLEAMSPFQGGGDMIRSVTFEKTEYNVLPYKFEAGTPDIAGIIGLGAAIDYLNVIGMDRISAYESDLLDYATATLSGLDGIRIIGNAPQKASVISFVVDGAHPHDVGTVLDQQGIAVRTGSSLRPARDGSLWHRGHHASLARFVQHRIRSRYAGCRNPQGAGVLSIMSDLSDLYQETIIDHSKRPRNRGSLEQATHTAEGYNPLCGDRLTLQLKIEDGRVSAVAFQGMGCAISTASASLMTDAIKGKTPEEAEVTFKKFHELLTEERPPAADLGKLAVFSGVREYPMRVKCATLAWHTLHAALQGEQKSISTE